MRLLTSYAVLLVVSVLSLGAGPLPALPAAENDTGTCPGAVASAGFSDVRGNVHEAAIDCLVWAGVAKGVTADQYAPARSVTREQTASFIVRMLERVTGTLPEANGATFDDVRGVHADAVQRLASAGIALGTTAESYAPGRAVTREQMATLLVRAQEYATGEPLVGGSVAFTDVSSNEHRHNVAKAVEAGLAVGISPTSFEPHAGVRRDQMASFMHRSLDRLAQEERKNPPDAGPEVGPTPAPAPDPEPEPAPGSGDVYAPPTHIADDCSQDETDALNEWLASLPDQSTIRLGQGACYLAEHTVQITDKAGWVLDGNGATLLRTEVTDPAHRYPHGNSHLRVVNSPAITLKNLAVKGTNDGRDLGGAAPDARGDSRSIDCYTQYGFTCYSTAFAFEHGVDLRGAPDVTVDNVTVDAVWGDGAYVSGADQFSPVGSDGAVLEDVTVSRNGRQGIAIVRSSDVLIDGADIRSSRRAGIDIEPDLAGEVIRNIEVRNSTVHSWLLAFASGGRGNVSDVFIHHNTVTHSGVPFVYVRATDGTRRANWRVHDNVVTYELGSPMPAVLFEHVDNASVVGNRVNVSAFQSRQFVGFRDVSGLLEVKNNDAGSATTAGLYTVDGVSLAPGVNACGNITTQGSGQPAGC